MALQVKVNKMYQLFIVCTLGDTSDQAVSLSLCILGWALTLMNVPVALFPYVQSANAFI